MSEDSLLQVSYFPLFLQMQENKKMILFIFLLIKIVVLILIFTSLNNIKIKTEKSHIDFRLIGLCFFLLTIERLIL